MVEILAFNRWPVTGIVIKDLGLQNYINLTPKIVPKTGAKHIGTRFHKSKNFIVERLINKVMNPGHKSKEHYKTSYHITGKGATAYKIVEKAFEIIEKKTNENPIKVFVEGLVNAAPREEIITIEYGGARYPKAVESAPQRRIDVVLRLFTQLSYHKSFNSKKPIEECLAEEIINAYKNSQNSGAIAKKLEMERQADASR